MKKLLLFAIFCFAMVVNAAVNKTIAVTTPGNLKTQLGGDLTTTTDLTITGEINAQDFETMKSSMTALKVIDMSGATVKAYTGTGGTAGFFPTTYNANTIPVNAFQFSNITSIKLPNTVIAIDVNAFARNFSLQQVILPSSVETIGRSAFYDCGELTQMTFPNSVKSIGETAFKYCLKLSTISIPNSVTTIGLNAFESTGLTSITVKWQTPLTISSTVFTDVVKSDCTLYVPTGTVTAYDGNTEWTDFIIQAYSSSAIENSTKSEILTITPNPTVDGFTLNAGDQSTQLTIVDLSGRTVLVQQVTGNDYISARDLKSGIYIVTVNHKSMRLVKK